MKSITTLLFLTLVRCAFASEQMPDFVNYDGQLCELEVRWEYPSPLQAYFIASAKRYPFEAWHTGNERGHVATWEITDSTLYLIEIKGEKAKIDLAKVFPDIKKKEKVKALWFSGIALVKTGKNKIELEDGTCFIKYENHVFIRFKKGKVVKTATLTEQQYKKAVKEYYSRLNTDNPVTEGPVHEYHQYIISCFVEEESRDKIKDK